MKKETWWDVLKSPKPKRKPVEFNYMHELEPHLRGPGQNKWGRQQNVRLRTYQGIFGKPNEGKLLTQAHVDAWMKRNGFVEPIITPEKLKLAFQHWPSIVSTKWTHAVCLHFPAWLANSKRGDEVCLRLKATKRYLNEIDRKAFGSAAARKRHPRIPRCVIEEWKDSTGFHIHMLMILPENIDPIAFIPLMEQEWHRQWKNANPAFKKHSFWADQIIGGHEPYISKHIGFESKALFYGDCTHFP